MNWWADEAAGCDRATGQLRADVLGDQQALVRINEAIRQAAEGFILTRAA